MNETAMLEAAELATTADGDETLYEVVRGQRQQMPPMGVYSVWIASLLQELLGTFARQRDIGWVVTEGLFILNKAADFRRRPDVAFVSAARWPLEKPIPEEGDWEVVPDLAIEVISPKERFQYVHGKVREYFEAGVRVVWLVIPSERAVHVYESPTSVRIMKESEELGADALLPGFRVRIGSLFQPK